MIPQLHRLKGNALVLGASHAGQIGPFGPYGGEDTEADTDETGPSETPASTKVDDRSGLSS